MRRMLLVMAMTAVGLAPVGPARAAVEDCPVGRICVWPKTDFRGSMVELVPRRFAGELCVALPFRSIKVHAEHWTALVYVNARCNEDGDSFAYLSPRAYDGDIFGERQARSISLSRIRKAG